MRANVAICMFLVFSLFGCNKPKLVVEPCDQDLGFANRKMHLSNVRFLQEDSAIDWFEIYMNLDERRKNEPAANCIPLEHKHSIEQEIDRNEHNLSHLR
jgi:hypothetical protein